MILNARLQTEQSPADSLPILLIHGLFGSLDNLGVLARGLKDAGPLLQVDVRNHGLSPRSDEMNYAVMAQDMVETLDAHGIDRVAVIGHSMGGKIAMTMSALVPERIERLVMIDIAPVDYQTRRHDQIFAGIRAVTDAGVSSRNEAAKVMRTLIEEEGVIQFLLKSFQEGSGASTSRCCGITTPRYLAGSRFPPGITRRCLFAATTPATWITAIAMRCCSSSRPLRRM